MSDKILQFYFWATPNGYKPLILLEELGLPYQLYWVDIGKGEQFSPEFLKIAPNNRIPALVDFDGPDSKSISIFESGAILQYLARKMGKFYGTDLSSQIEIEQWLFWQMGGLGPMAGQLHHFNDYAPEKFSYAVTRYSKEVARLYGVMNDRLKTLPFLGKEYSIADMACFPWVRSHKRQGIDLADYSHVKKWFETIHSRPSVERALAIGDDKKTSTVLKNDPKARKIMFDV